MKKNKLFNSLKLITYIYLLLYMVKFPVYALGSYNDLTEMELIQLPPFCKLAREQGNTRELQAKYGFRDPQHLCPGLNALNHAQASRNNRNYILGVAVGELSYVLGHNERFPLRPVVLRKRGNVYAMRGEIGKAIADYEEAIKLKSNYINVYSDLADIYLNNRNKKQALDIINKGLKIKPKSKGLLRKKKFILGE